MHPITYLNKILLGSKQGTMQLWNIKTSQLVYSFKANNNSAITIIKQVKAFKILYILLIIYFYFKKAPAIDVVGIGYENGRIILHNLKFDEVIVSFIQEWGQVKSLAFRTGKLKI